MSDEQQRQGSAGMFQEPAAEKRLPATAVGVAALVVVVLVALAVVLGHRSTHGTADAAAYAANLSLSGIQMSEADTLSGGKQTYLDGTITNHGAATVTGVRVAVQFANDQALPPQVLTAALGVIRMREPYVDVTPMSAAPLAPGTQAPFRLILEGVGENWNQQEPSLQVVGVTLQ